MANAGGPTDDVEGPDLADPAPTPDGSDRSLAPQAGRTEPARPDDEDDEPAPGQAGQSQQ